MKRFLLDVVAPLRRSDSERAERPLHWLLAAAIVLPGALFLTGAAISYRQHVTEARDRLQRNLGTVYEHGLKVFETSLYSSWRSNASEGPPGSSRPSSTSAHCRR